MIEPTRIPEAPPPPARVRRWMDGEGLAVAVLAAATVSVCWPLSIFRAFPANRDAIFTLIAMERIQDALLGRGDPRSIGLAWPTPSSITQSDWVLGQAVLALPFRWGGVEPLYIGTIIAMIGLFATAWATHRLARVLLGPGPHTWVAGVIGGLCPAQLLHLQHVNLVHHEVTVGAALLLGAGLAGRRPVVAGLGGLLLTSSAHFGAYLGVHTGVAGAIVVAAVALTRQGSPRAWLAAVAGAVVGGVTLLPVAVVYVDVAQRYGTWFDLEGLRLESWDLAQTLAPLSSIPIHAAWLGTTGAPIRDPANPGYVAALLALVGVVGLRRVTEKRWAWAAVVATAIVAGLLALGPELIWGNEPTGIPGPYRLLAALPGMRGIRSPARWFGVAFLALALPAGLGAHLVLVWIRARLGGAVAALAGVGLVGALVVETPTPNTYGKAQNFVLEDVYRAVDALPPGGLLDMALLKPKTAGCNVPFALRAALFHGRALVGGMFARIIPDLDAVHAVAHTWPSDDALQLLRAIGVVAVIEHYPSGSPPDGVTCAWFGDHRLCQLDGAVGGSLLTPASVGEAENGPVIGVRYPARSPVPATLDVACGRDRLALSTQAWRAISEVRHGAGRASPLDVFLAEPCENRVAASPRGAVLLYAARDHAAEPIVSPPPRTTRTIADSFRTLGMASVIPDPHLFR